MKNSAGKVLFWMTACAAAFLIYASATVEAQTVRTWAVNPTVKYYGEDSPYAKEAFEEAIREAIWVWSSRIPALDIRYAGMTAAPVERAVITYQWKSLDDYLKIINNPFSQAAEQKWTYLDTGYIAKSAIYLNLAYFSGSVDACDLTVMSHELGHALGINGHSPLPDDLMYYAPAHCRYMPSDNDIKLLGHPPATCHSVLAKDYGIYIPDVLGKSAMLQYQGGEVWKLEYLKDNPHAHGCETVSVDGNQIITITDLQGYSGEFSRVELAPIADNTWKLQWAE